MPNWNYVLKEIQSERDEPPGGESAADKVRLKYLIQLEKRVQRNIICYYSGFLSKPKNIEGLEINDEDTNGFMLCIHGMEREKGLDLFLHTPGGDGAATEAIVHYLREMFGRDIRAFVPQIAMSAGTIIACACREIFLGKHSNLGPVDPQINGIAAYSVLSEIETAFEDIVNDDRRSVIWNPVLSNYTPGFIQNCTDAKDSAKEMVTGFLKTNMFADLPEGEREAQADRVFDGLAEVLSKKGHSKHIYYDDLHKMGLNVRPLEDPKDRVLQDLVLTIHHCMMYTMSNTPAVKIIENHSGRRWVKMLQMTQPAMNFNMPPDILDGLRAEMEAEKAKRIKGP